MNRCSVPGCPNEGSIVVPVGPDTPTIVIDEDGESYFEADLTGPAPTFVTGRSCPDHIQVVRRALQERHQPRHMAIREGRP